MALIDDVKVICDRLAPLGWRKLLQEVTGGEVDIQQATAAALRQQLLKPLPAVDRSMPGFSDFSLDGSQAITPGSPAQSVLYHALASPGVTDGVDDFPTLREIETVENFVFGVQPPTLAALRARAGLSGTKRLAVVLFAYEYRPARDTCAKLQADLTFARTGVARVGTRRPLYDRRRRGFVAEVEEDPYAFRVCPAHYGAFLAVRVKGAALPVAPMGNLDDDDDRQFWLPVHKLFDGRECLAGLDLYVEFTSFHYNDKIRRIREKALGLKNVPTSAPFRFSEGIAEIDEEADACRGLLVPTVHQRLVEPARVGDDLLTFRVPKRASNFGAFEPGAEQDASTGAEVRPAPAYVHARTEVREGMLVDLSNDPTRPDVQQTVGQGGYDALHYVDFTGDGSIGVEIAALSGNASIATRTVPCYSIVAAPDFFPDAGQRELFDEVPANLWGVPPEPLSSTRLPANLQMPDNDFDPSDDTITAVVPMFGPRPSALTRPHSRDASRHSCLPDDCAGVFAPGWDVSTDKVRIQSRRVHHLAAYGLGSPFPEDSKLCAALSTFWPAVAPDATRGMSPTTGNPALRSTVAPLTDEEIGQRGTLPWDGVPGPVVTTIDGQEFAECRSFMHVDYVQQALEERFTLRLTGRVSSEEYMRRMMTMGLVYELIGGDRNDRFVLSFRAVAAGDEELQDAQIDASVVLPGAAYRVDVIRGGADTEQPHPTNFRRRLLPIRDRRFFFVDPVAAVVLHRRASQPRWNVATPPA